VPHAAAQGVCVDCGEPLPDVEGLIFCPHCGADQTAVACESCGSPIRGSWNFCIRCGTRRPTGSAPS
jgi:predicted amidophosphoribosyltransferase